MKMFIGISDLKLNKLTSSLRAMIVYGFNKAALRKTITETYRSRRLIKSFRLFEWSGL